MSEAASGLGGVADYTFVRLLGDGSQGSVYLAVPPSRLGIEVRHVAVKVLARKATDEEFQRAVDELRLFAAQRSPYTTTLIEAGRQENGTVYYSMEHFPLGSLGAPGRQLSRADVLGLVAHAARGAHALHEAGIAHRDIKPTNVMMHASGGKLSDPDLAHVMSPGQTFSGRSPIDSVFFMEPGVLRGQPPSRASDVWALGVTLHVALTGRPVYEASTDGNLLSALRTVLAGTPRIDSSLTDAEADIVSRCLAADPADRPPTAEALADHLEGLLARR